MAYVVNVKFQAHTIDNLFVRFLIKLPNQTLDE